MLRTTARILLGLIGVALALSAALVVAEPVPNDPSPGNRLEDKRLQADDFLRRARQAMAENDFAAASQLIDQADSLGVQYSPFFLGDTPKTLRRELDRKAQGSGRIATRSGTPASSRSGGSPAAGPADPFSARGAPSGDPKSTAKQCILKARRELDAGNLPGAVRWYQEAAKQRATFGPNEDSPERLAADIRRSGGAVDEAPPAPPRGSRSVVPLPPTDAAAPASPLAARPMTPAAAQPPLHSASQLLLEARRALALGDVRVARDQLERARAMNAQYHPLGDTPEKVEATMAGYMDVMAQRNERGNTDGWRRQYAKSLMDQADALLRWRDFDEAERLAWEAAKQRAGFTPYELRPETLLEQIANARRQGRVAPPIRDPGVVPAGSELIAPATGGDFDRRANAAVYDPLNDPTRNVRAANQQPLSPGGIRPPPPAAPPPGSAHALFQQGEAALRAHDTQTALQFFRQANERAGELDPSTARRLHELLQLLASPGTARPAAPGQQAVDEVAAKQQLQANQMAVEVGNQLVAARNARQTDAKQAMAILEQARSKVESAGLDPSHRDPLLRRIDAALADTRRFVAENRPRLELDEQNQQVRQQVDREQQAELDVQSKLKQKTEEFNTLMRERRFAEAEVAAKQALELAPTDPTAAQMVTFGKLARHWFNSRALRDEKESGFVAGLESVEAASVPFDDRDPLKFPDPKEWKEKSGLRAKYAKDRGRKLTPGEMEIYQRLKTPISVQFENAPLAQVIDQLGKLANVNIHLDPQGLSDEGVSTDVPVNINLPQAVRLESALNLILRPLHLGYVVKDEVLKVTSERLRAGDVHTVVYNVADLVIPIPNFIGSGNTGLEAAYQQGMHGVNPGGTAPFGGAVPAPLTLVANKDGRPAHAALNPQLLAQVSSNNRGSVPANMPVVGGPGGMGGGSMADFDSLIDLIQNTIAPDSWLDAGGAGTIEPFETSLSLVVSQTQQIHEEITDLLEQLRRLQDLQVTIEVRFITLNDNFFERIGVDFDFNINDRMDHPGMFWGRIINPGTPGAAGSTGAASPARDTRIEAWHEFGSEPSTVVGLSQAGPPPLFTADLDIPFTQNSFGLAVPQFGGFDASAGAQMGFAILSDIEAFFFINAAQSDKRSNVLQAPKVTLFNGQYASISDQSQTPFVMSVIPVVGDFASAQQPVIVVLAEGTHLTVQAVVSSDRRFVRLTVIPYFSQINEVNTFQFTGSETTITDSSQEGVQDQPNDNTKKADTKRVERSGTTVQLPTFSYVNVSTTVSVPDGGTILLGGIKRLSEGRNEAGVPILNKIPYINRLFKNVGIGRETQSLMMMVTPRIIIQEEEEAKLGVTPGP